MRRTFGPLGRTPQDTAEYIHAVRPILQGFALRWMNGWAFGPDDLRTSVRNEIVPKVLPMKVPVPSTLQRPHGVCPLESR